MAYDYLTKIRINRPLTEEEVARRIDVHKPVVDEAADAYTVFGMNDVYLEVCDASYSQVGWGLLAFLLCFPAFALLTVEAVQSAIVDTPAMVRNGEQGMFSAGMWVFTVITVLCCVLTVVILLRDCFNYRHKAVRFNRQTRMVYAFRHNGPGGVIAVPWDKAFFYPHRLPSNGLAGGAPTLMRCFVLDDAGKNIVNTFSFGARTVNGADESTPMGKQVLYQIQANFEFIRRYMEQGPGALPKVERYLPRGPSLRASMSVWFYGIGAVGRANGAMRVLTILLSGPIFLLSILHYIAQLTSREPVWPTDVEAACGNSESTAMAQA
ncbi:DUF6708 domain-containing protein [Paraburkholderia phenoliruptrix]|uniref:DUF6708 domain-containing protein n=2 Tax=Paraburkholderia phenoliruptrix TaxID=252970 RepID=K0DJR5_9BURK|nr:DUF6708 domain-containing protein [Paraburkholderia phenoliruptrix]AFT84163.1 hypothetical protein BUPH_03924 [Paraburkholderia phenoliruptrix BR3459a]MDR6387708.1 hypothetical protein [Paraburkholderia phenoliruptrix]CAB4050904.1 hypothetical protein LMG9964_04571 [Paraburkholderia phenoliruptrix]